MTAPQIKVTPEQVTAAQLLVEYAAKGGPPVSSGVKAIAGAKAPRSTSGTIGLDFGIWPFASPQPPAPQQAAPEPHVTATSTTRSAPAVDKHQPPTQNRRGGLRRTLKTLSTSVKALLRG